MIKMIIVNRIVTIINKLINIFTTIILVFFIFIGFYALYDINHIYNNAKLDKDILSIKPDQNNIEKFSLNDLKAINENIVGWITIDNTNIDYPVLQADDNTKYLNLDYHDEFSSAGSIFLDYRNEGFYDDYSIIYGHHMSNDRMFSDITKFSDINFFNSHKTGRLYTDSGVYNLEIYSYAIINAFNNVIYNLRFYKNNSNEFIINNLDNSTILKRETEFKDSKIILLSTCNIDTKNDREVLLAKMTLDNDESDLIVKHNKEKTTEDNSILKVNKDNKIDYNEKFNIFSKGGLMIVLSILVLIIYVVLIIKLWNKKNKNIS